MTGQAFPGEGWFAAYPNPNARRADDAVLYEPLIGWATFVEDGYDPDRCGIVRLPLISWTPAADELPGFLGYVHESASDDEHKALRVLALLQLEMEQPALLVSVAHPSVTTQAGELLRSVRGGAHAVYWTVPGSSFVARTPLTVADTEIARDILAAAGHTVKRVRNRIEDWPAELLDAMSQSLADIAHRPETEDAQPRRRLRKEDLAVLRSHRERRAEEPGRSPQGGAD